MASFYSNRKLYPSKYQTGHNWTFNYLHINLVLRWEMSTDDGISFGILHDQDSTITNFLTLYFTMF